VRWRRTARDDLLQLARWIAGDNPQAAHRFLDAEREPRTCSLTCPDLAQRAFSEPEFAPYPHLAYPRFDRILMIYAAECGGIDVLRVVHGARDLDALDVDLP
jgi:toxin ParE1/3/4